MKAAATVSRAGTAANVIMLRDPDGAIVDLFERACAAQAQGAAA